MTLNLPKRKPRPPYDVTQEDVTAYLARVDMIGARRKKNGSLAAQNADWLVGHSRYFLSCIEELLSERKRN